MKKLPERGQPLTPQEIKVAELISQGLPNKLIASELKISEHTAKFHVSNVQIKLGASNRVMSAMLWREHSQNTEFAEMVATSRAATRIMDETKEDDDYENDIG